MDRFSSRHRYEREDAEITIRHDAPVALREAVISIAYGCGLNPRDLHSVLCTILYRAPDRNNWTDFPNIDEEVRGLSEDLEWFEVYDFIEALAGAQQRGEHSIEHELNRCFRRMGVGWQLIGGRLEVPGTETFELTVRHGIEQLRQLGKTTASPVSSRNRSMKW